VNSAVVAATRPLDGVRVLDLSNRSGAYCGKLLADLGADVILVEHPRGHELRGAPPFRDGPTGGKESLAFAYYNNNKRGISLDYGDEIAEPLLLELGRTADVILTSHSLRRPVFGISDPGCALTWAGPSSSVCSITPYGRTGPWRNWRATPLTAHATTGQMQPVGPVAGPPAAMPGQQVYDKAGIRAAAMIQAELLRRDDIGPQNIDLSIQEVSSWEMLLRERFAQSGRITTRETNFGPPPGGVWECLDGAVDIAAHAPRHWDIFLDVIGRPEDLTESLYAERSMRVQLFDLLTNLISPHLKTMSAQEFVERGQAQGLPCALMYSPAQFLQDKQPVTRGFWIQTDAPGLGRITIPGRPYQSQPESLSFRRSAPAFGEHNREIYVNELGHSDEELRKWVRDGLV
jgi:crotonobetainyl-CoA:carnitine CoA-transferase CaiB-like acyl-CoA transferase